MPSALIVGAGLAGLAAAIDLVDAGWQVTVLECRPFAGGRTFSFSTEGEDLLDNGQHVFLGCCSAYIGLLGKLNCRERAFLQRRLDVPLLDDKDGPARLFSVPLPAPFHLLPAFLRFPYLSLSEKLAALRALLLIRISDLPEEQTFAGWLAAHRQTSNAIARFWNLIVVPTCNTPAERISARQGGFVFREGFLRNAGGANIGYPRVGLSDVLPVPAVDYLQARGTVVRFGTTLARLRVSGRAVDAAETTAGEDLNADAYVLAVPSNELRDLIGQDWAKVAARLTYAPIVGVNLWFDRPVFDGEILAVILGGETFWLFDRTRILGRQGPAHHVAVSISAADALMNVPRAELASKIVEKLRGVLPLAAEAALLRSSVTKVRQATFVPAPGSTRWRLSARTPLRNLFLAGAWTDTGWPETMESAIRSGHTAARLAAASQPAGLDRRAQL